MSEAADYFGTDAQQEVLRRSRAVYGLMRNDPRCTYYGRSVGLCTPADAAEETLDAFLTLQGTASIARVSADEMPSVEAEMTSRGLSVTRYDRWLGHDDCVAAAKAITAQTSLPEGLTLSELTSASDPELFEALAQLATSCGVMLPNLAVLRGELRPGTCFVATTPEGRAVSCAAGAAFAHPDHPTLSKEAWWGMLATAQDWRGHRLALLLGAQAILALRSKLPGCTIMTGVQPGNAPSEAVCSKLGLAPDGTQVATIVDPSALPGGKLTS
ncbi:MAG: N-acetyltransferase [Pseudomonadota bacterium]